LAVKSWASPVLWSLVGFAFRCSALGSPPSLSLPPRAARPGVIHLADQRAERWSHAGAVDVADDHPADPG